MCGKWPPDTLRTLPWILIRSYPGAAGIHPNSQGEFLNNTNLVRMCPKLGGPNCVGFIVRQTIYTGSWGSPSWRHRYDETCLKSWSSARQRIENWKPVLTLVRMRLQRKLRESQLDLAKEMQTSCSRSLLRCSRPTPVSKCGKTLRLSNFLHFTRTTWSVPWHMHLLFPDATNVVRDHWKKNPKLNTMCFEF